MHTPYIGAEKKLPELTVKAMLLGVVLSVVLTGANAYFGLFAGMTVSASIPAAVISMVVLRFFRKSNILENNLVQTSASAGESLASGVIFTMPALVMMGYWEQFNYWETTLICLSGGLLGVLFTVPLRQALIVREKLQFPEGLATAEVLKTGEEAGKSVKYLITGGLIGLLFKFAEGTLKLWPATFEKAAMLGKKGIMYFGTNLSPALVAVGYIVGLNIALLIFMGGSISWYVAIPIYLNVNGIPAEMVGESAADIGWHVWNGQIRYLGVGAMVVGGLWALISLRKSLGQAFSQGLAAFKKGGQATVAKLRTELDMPLQWVIIGIGVLLVPIFFIYLNVIAQVPISLVMALVMVVAGFLFSAVAGYMAGLVGSSNNPISGVTIATILFASLLLLAMLGSGGDVQKGAAAAIMVGAVVACAAAIAGDNMQDLKAGYMLGSTPRKQQVMQMVGVTAAALTVAPVLNLLLDSYGMGANAGPDALQAPQAALMHSVAVGIFEQNLPWTMVGLGAALAVVIIMIDQWLKARGSNFRTPVLAVAVGIYLPLELDFPIFLGGVVAWLVSRYVKRREATSPIEGAKKRSEQAGLLLASGIITGEALMGIGIAVLMALNGNDALALLETPMPMLGLGLWLVVTLYVLRATIRAYRN